MSASAGILGAEQAKSLIEGIRIPPQPDLLLKVMQLVRAPEPDLTQVADTVGTDVSLSAAVLKTINSPFFGLRNRIGSIRHATSLLGLRNVLNLVVSVSLRKSVSDDTGMKLDHFWDAAQSTALASAAVARSLSVGSPDEAYSLGLFHDCGIPLMMQKFPNYVRVLREGFASVSQSPAELEDARLGTNHAVVGYFVARSWNLPDTTAQAILEHHNLHRVDLTNSELAGPLAVLQLGAQLSHYHRRATDNYDWERCRGPVMEVLCLSGEDYLDLRAEIGDMLDEA